MLKHYCFQLWVNKLTLSTVITAFFASPVSAQIVPDNSLGSENSIVTPNVAVQDKIADLIEGGAIRGNNLFHSFEQFNVDNGAAVYFANPDGIANILTRVTGNNISEIFGTLGVLKDTASHIDGAANLFLLNPNGIVFGKDAALDVNGSFFATTAESYVFSNGLEYSATNPETPPLLTVNIPVGLQFNTNPGVIEVHGTGNNLVLNPVTFEFLFRNTRPAGLKVPSGNTLALIGGTINLTGGNLTAPQGRIELGSVAEEGKISLNLTQDGLTFDYQNLTNFNNINLTKSASIDVSGSGGGNIHLQGQNISLSDSSAIISSTLGNNKGGTIRLSASDTLKIISAEGGLFPSGIFTQVESSATGNGSNLNIEAGNIEIIHNALINNTVSGAGNGGEMEIKTGSLTLTGSSTTNFYPTGIFAQVSPLLTALGKSNNLTVEADQIKITQGALIATATFGEGDSGDIFIQTDSLELSGTGSLFLFPNNPIPSGVFTTVALPFVTGNGGNITIETESLKISDGGQIRAGTLGLGDSGNILIKAKDTSITDTSLLLDLSVASGIFSSSGLGILTGETQQTTGNGGNITIETEKLTLANGGQIGAGTSSTGNSGNLFLKASEINIIGQLFDSQNEALTGFADTSGLFTSVVRADALGNGGDILVETDKLQLINGGAIAANVFGGGKGGDIQINAQTINISDSFVVSDVRSGITTTVEATGTGDAGNIGIVADNLSIINGGSIAASSIGNANAGDINLLVVDLKISGVSPTGQLFSQISAFSQSDFAAGTINLSAENVSVSDRGLISVSNLSNGNSGNLNIKAWELTLDNSATIEAKVNAGTQGNINLTTNNIFLRNNSEITAKASSTATGGNITIDNTDNIVLLDNSKIIADAIQGNGGNINIKTVGLFTSFDSLITASSEYGLDGVVKIEEVGGDRKFEFNQLPESIVDTTNLIIPSCSTGYNNAFAVIGNGGVPNSPYSTQSLSTTWYDLRPVKPEKSEIAALATPLQEATATIINSNGKLELVALTPLSTHRWMKSSCKN